jgi:hypothetical protein
LRDNGFPDPELQRLGESLGQYESAVVFDIGTDAVAAATKVLESLEATRIVEKPIDSSVATLFA